MTVAQLIEQLKKLPQDAMVIYRVTDAERNVNILDVEEIEIRNAIPDNMSVFSDYTIVREKTDNSITVVELT